MYCFLHFLKVFLIDFKPLKILLRNKDVLKNILLLAHPKIKHTLEKEQTNPILTDFLTILIPTIFLKNSSHPLSPSRIIHSSDPTSWSHSSHLIPHVFVAIRKKKLEVAHSTRNTIPFFALLKRRGAPVQSYSGRWLVGWLAGWWRTLRKITYGRSERKPK